MQSSEITNLVLFYPIDKRLEISALILSHISAECSRTRLLSLIAMPLNFLHPSIFTHDIQFLISEVHLIPCNLNSPLNVMLNEFDCRCLVRIFATLRISNAVPHSLLFTN